jgi:hypothetical protein
MPHTCQILGIYNILSASTAQKHTERMLKWQAEPPQRIRDFTAANYADEGISYDTLFSRIQLTNI